MLECAIGYHRDIGSGRWVIETRHRRTRWEVVVEPDSSVELVVVITAYPLKQG